MCILYMNQAALSRRCSMDWILRSVADGGSPLNITLLCRKVISPCRVSRLGDCNLHRNVHTYHPCISRQISKAWARGVRRLYVEFCNGWCHGKDKSYWWFVPSFPEVVVGGYLKIYVGSGRNGYLKVSLGYFFIFNITEYRTMRSFLFSLQKYIIPKFKSTGDVLTLSLLPHGKVTG